MPSGTAQVKGAQPTMKAESRESELERRTGVPVSPDLNIDEVFDDLGLEALKVFQDLQVKSFYPPGTVFLAEGQPPAGIFFLRAGKVRLFRSGPAGERIICRTAQIGEILGVTEGVSGGSYRMSAQTLTPTEVGFISREAFLQFLCAHGVVAFRLVQLLSDRLDSSYCQLRSMTVGRFRRQGRQSASGPPNFCFDH